MTVKRLRTLLQGSPDDAVVFASVLLASATQSGTMRQAQYILEVGKSCTGTDICLLCGFPPDTSTQKEGR